MSEVTNEELLTLCTCAQGWTEEHPCIAHPFQPFGSLLAEIESTPEGRFGMEVARRLLDHEAELSNALSAQLATISKAVGELRVNKHIHHGSWVQGHNTALDEVLQVIEAQR